MRVGFTGTRAGMSVAQRHQLEEVLRWLSARDGSRDIFHHGCAVGADTEAEAVAIDDGWYIVAHPATEGRELARNREIVAAVDVLVAAPRLDREERRSGTWATVRCALAAGKPVILLARDESGTVTDGYLRWLDLQMADICRGAAMPEQRLISDAALAVEVVGDRELDGG